MQDTLEAAADPRTVANGYLQDCRPASVPRSSSWLHRFNSTGNRPCRGAPEHNEHGDAILADLGLDWDTVVDLKVRGVVG